MVNSAVFRSNPPEVLLEEGALKICSKFTGQHSCRSAISIKLLCNFIEITFRHGCSPVNLLHIFRTPFSKNTYGRLLLCINNAFSSKCFSKNLVALVLHANFKINDFLKFFVVAHFF